MITEIYEPTNKSVDDLNGEVWADIDGFVGIYAVSNFGRIKSIGRIMWRGNRYYLSKTKIMSQNKCEGYNIVMFYSENSRKNYRVHRLIAKAFIPNIRNKPQINHKNGIRDDNRIDNLEWTDQSENMAHCRNVLNKRVTSGSENPLSKTVFMYSLDMKYIGLIKGLRLLQSMGYCRCIIRECATGKRSSYKDIVWSFTKLHT